MTDDWVRPNWRNPEEYQSQASLSLHLWYWEFLRRRPDYVTDYWMYAEETYESYCEIYEKMGMGNQDTYRPEHENFDANIPTSYYKYNILSCPNPRKNRPSGFYYTADKTISLVKNSGDERSCPIELSPDQVAILFNLQLPITQQIKEAQRMLSNYQKLHTEKTEGMCRNIQKRRHIEKWPSYLRAIDASDKGEILEEIGLLLSAPCLSEEGIEEYLFNVGSEKIKRIGQTIVDAARQVQFNFPY